MPDLSEPSLDLLQQDYDEINPGHTQAITVPIKFDGPGMVHELPARTAMSRPINTSLADVIEVASFDLRRKYLKIVCTQAVFIGHDKTLVAAGDVGQLPAGVVLDIPTAAQTWCRAVTVAGVLSYWMGQWAD